MAETQAESESQNPFPPPKDPKPVKRPRKIRKTSPNTPDPSNKSVTTVVRTIPRPLSADGEIYAAIRHLRNADPHLAAIIDAHEPPSFHGFLPPFQTLTRSIINQQLAFKAAATTYARFVALCGGTSDSSVTPDTVLNLSPTALREIGVSSRKASYLRDLAKKFHTGVLSDEMILNMDDRSVISMLTMVEGIGAWSVHMFLIFSLHRPDVLPVGDGGVRRGVQMLYGLEEVPRPSQMEKICEKWRPYRSVGSWYMWRLSEGRGIVNSVNVGIGSSNGGDIGHHQTLLIDNIQVGPLFSANSERSF